MSSRTWLSIHFYFDGVVYGEDGDRVLIEVVKPTVELARESMEVLCSFFVRYIDDGPHIRLRIATPSSADQAEAKARLSQIACETCLGKSVKPVWKAYEPEVARYGGPRGIIISEQLFEVSSEFALDAVADNAFRTQRNARLASALLSEIVLLNILNVGERPHSSNILANLNRSLRVVRNNVSSGLGGHQPLARPNPRVEAVRPFVRESWRRLSSGESLTISLDHLRYGVEIARNQIVQLFPPNDAGLAAAADVMGYVQGSYLHMMNNRLGVLPREEGQLLELAAWALSDEEAVDALGK